MYFELSSLGFALSSIGFIILSSALFPLDKAWARSIITVFCAFLGFRYITWRCVNLFGTTVEYSFAQNIWLWIVLITEIAIFVEILVFLVILSRKRSRTAEADNFQKFLEAQADKPSVAVFIPTFNEPFDVIEKTIIGAANIDYPNFTVWVLDDGKRDWLKELCSQVEGANYLARPDNSGAKAGNLNYGLSKVKSDFIAILDADFVAHRNFLNRTVGFFKDPKIGIVQTPQHFYNFDPIQTNLGLTELWHDEQRIFFDEMAEGRDAWNCAFCCGSCSVIRREALDATGGQFPTESVSEDLLTTLQLLRAGFKTIYLNERLSLGLAADSTEGFFVQRERWCLGGIQSIFLKKGPLGPRLSFMKRFLFFPWGWLIQYPSRFILMIIPPVYMLTGLVPIEFTSLEEFAIYLLPVLSAYFLMMQIFVPNYYIPILTTAQTFFATFRMLPTVLSSVVKPFGEPFRVTPKGNKDVTADKLEYGTALGLFLLLLATLGGVLINILPETRVISGGDFFPVALVWTAFNAVGFILALMMCFEGPRKRQEERFETNETALLRGDEMRKVLVYDLSVSGALIEAVDVGDVKGIRFEDTREIPIEVSRRAVDNITGNITFAVKFEDSPATRRDMIRKVFSGRYNKSLSTLSYRKILLQLLRRLFGKALGQ